MNLKKEIILIICLFVLSSCNSNKFFIPNKDIVFMNGFKGRFSGTFYSNKISADVIYFADLVTHKKINIFEQNGNLIEKIDVKAIPYLESSWGFEMISNDTIIITVGNPIQLIYILNDKAEIVKQIVISEIQGNVKDKYTLDAPYQRTLYNNSKIYLSYRHFKDKEHFYTDYLYSRTYNDSLIQSPYITSIDIIEKNQSHIIFFMGFTIKAFQRMIVIFKTYKTLLSQITTFFFQ